MRVFDRILGWFLVVLGCVHNFVAAPLTYNELSTQALWFVSAGLALWYAGFLNLLRAQAVSPGWFLCVVCLLTNISLLAFVVAYAVVKGNWASPGAIALIGTVAVLTAMSILALVRTSRAGRHAPDN